MTGLSGKPGSFMGPKQREEMFRQAERASTMRFEKGQQSAEEQGQPSRQAMHAAHASYAGPAGAATYEAPKAQDLEGPLLDAEHTSWTRQAPAGGQEAAPDAETSNPNAAFRENEEEHEEVYTDSEGHQRCKQCESILKRATEIPISDSELMTYMLGGRISATFRVGKMEFVLETLAQQEIDFISSRLARDIQQDAFATNNDAHARKSVYQLVFALAAVGVDGRTTEEIMPSRAKSPAELVKAFDEKYAKLRSWGHNVLVTLSEKEAILESTVKALIEDTERIKN